MTRPPGCARFPYTTLFRSGGEAAAHGVFEGGGLLEDFLEHVVRVVAELGVVNVPGDGVDDRRDVGEVEDRKSTRLNSSHVKISYAVFCLKKKKIQNKYN